MTSMALTSVTAYSPILSKRAGPSPLATFGLGPNAVVLPKLTTTSPKISLAVKAQKFEGDLQKDLKLELNSTEELSDDLLHNSRFELTPWDYKEEANKIKMWFNMPGVAAQDIRVYIKDQKLFIQGKHLHLPPCIRKEDITATLGNGVLYVLVPKTKPEFEAHPIIIQPISW